MLARDGRVAVAVEWPRGGRGVVCGAGMGWIACDQARMDRRKPGHSWPKTREAGLRAPRSYIQPVCIFEILFMGSSFPACGGDGRGAIGGKNTR